MLLSFQSEIDCKKRIDMIETLVSLSMV